MVWACILVAIAGIILEAIKYNRRLIQKRQSPSKKERLADKHFPKQKILKIIQLAVPCFEYF